MLSNCAIKLISWFCYCRHFLSLILGWVKRGWMEKKINSVTWICNIGNFYYEWISCVSNFIIESLLNLWRLNLMKFKTSSRALWERRKVNFHLRIRGACILCKSHVNWIVIAMLLKSLTSSTLALDANRQ